MITNFVKVVMSCHRFDRCRNPRGVPNSGEFWGRITISGWHGQTGLTALLWKRPVAQEDTLTPRLGVAPIDQVPDLPRPCRTRFHLDPAGTPCARAAGRIA